MKEIDELRGKVNQGRDTRLFNEWDSIDRLCEDNPFISYTIQRRNPFAIPLKYEIVFQIKSIIGVEKPDEQGLEKPLFGYEHRLLITIPNNYPSVDSGYPEFKFVTDVWHPNIRYFGDFKGRICLNLADSGRFTLISKHIERIADYLSYDDYHAENIYPYPEDQTVAQWVMEQAIPQNWLHFNNNTEI